MSDCGGVPTCLLQPDAKGSHIQRHFRGRATGAVDSAGVGHGGAPLVEPLRVHGVVLGLRKGVAHVLMHVELHVVLLVLLALVQVLQVLQVQQLQVLLHAVMDGALGQHVAQEQAQRGARVRPQAPHLQHRAGHRAESIEQDSERSSASWMRAPPSGNVN